MNKYLLCVAIVVVSNLGFASTAAAVFLTGSLSVGVNQGQYCDPSSMNCTHARFPISQQGTCQPIREAVVGIYTTGGSFIAATETDASGNYIVSFPHAGGDVELRWYYIHADNHFRVGVETAPEVTRYGFSTFSVASSGTTTKNICFFDQIYRQAWIGASRVWHEAFRYSGTMLSNFLDVTVLAEVQPPSVDPNNAKYDFTTNTVLLGAGSARYPLSDTHHEMGHAAHYLARLSPALLGFSGAQNWPDPCPNGRCGTGEAWSLSSQEWRSLGFQEGLASFLGMVGMYWYDAPQPQYCTNSLVSCGTAASGNMEVGPACASTESRRPRAAIRLLWDIYDMIDDVGFDDTIGAGTSSAFIYGQLINELSTYSTNPPNNGFANGQLNEPWADGTFAVMDAIDGRSMEDFYIRLDTGVPTTIINANCNP